MSADVRDEYTLQMNWDPDVRLQDSGKKSKKKGAWIWGLQNKKTFAELNEDYPKHANNVRLKRCVLACRNIKKPKVLQEDRKVSSQMKANFNSCPEALQGWIKATRRERQLLIQGPSAAAGEEKAENGNEENLKKIDIQYSKMYQPPTTHLLLTGDIMMETFTPMEKVPADEELTAVHMHLPVDMDEDRIGQCLRFIEDACLCKTLAVKVLVS